MNQSDLVTQSFGRCLAFDTLLFDRFYNHFLKSSPQIAVMFKNTDMVKQKKLLRAGINYAIMLSAGTSKTVAEGVLSKIRESHSRAKLNVKPDLYPLWTTNLLKAIKETDPKFSLEIENAWRKVLESAVEYIALGY